MGSFGVMSFPPPGTIDEFVSDSWRYYGHRVLECTAAAERELWIGVVVLSLADLVLTIYGLEAGLVETNPIAVAALNAVGYPGLCALKAIGLGTLVVGRHLAPGRLVGLVPLGLLVPTAVAVGTNATLILLYTT